jgi:hypothetical protein
MTLKELRALAIVATPGRIGFVQCGLGKKAHFYVVNVDIEELHAYRFPSKHDMAFINAANPQTVLQLLDDLEIAREALEFYADSSKWKESTVEPMKSLGFKPSMLAQQALERMKLK